MNIKVGELNRRIEIGTIQNVKDADGFDTKQFTPITKMWAKVNNMSGTEIFKAGSDYSKVKTRFLIRYRKDININTDMNIRFNSKLYNIVYVNNYNYSNEYIELIGEVIE